MRDDPEPHNVNRSQANETKGGYKYRDAELAYDLARDAINRFAANPQEELDLSEYGLEDLPLEIEQLSKLENLNLEKNKLSVLPPEIGGLTNLTTLNLGNNNLVDLPQEFVKLAALKYLALDDNRLSNMTPEIGQLNALIRLSIDRNRLDILPTGIAKLASLRVLSLNGNQLRNLPSIISELINLGFLSVESNQLSELPAEIGRLLKLQHLYLANNQINALPLSIARCIELRTLHLKNNRLSVLSPDLAQLTNLENLNLDNNQLAALPLEMGQLRSLEAAALRDKEPIIYGLSIKDNPLPQPYPSLIIRGQPAATINVLAWLRGELDPATLSDRSFDNLQPTPPQEPLPEAGPEFSLGSGKLDLVPGHETENAFDRATQVALHNRIIRRIEPLRAETVKVGNRHPGLALTVEEYANLISQPFDELDVTDLWAVGNGLLAHAISFEKQNETRTLTEPLEPAHFALLFDVARLHAGFILGFPKAIELTERADRAQIAPDVFDLIDDPTSNILSALSQNRKLVSDRARHLAEALQAAMTVAGWGTTRVGYTSYATVRNALIQLCRVLIWTNDKGGSLAGSVVVGSALAASGLSAETVQLVFQFLHFNASNMVAFAAPFPELRAWVGWIIDHFDEEHISQRSDDASKPSI